MDLFDQQDAKRTADKLNILKKRKRKALAEESKEEESIVPATSMGLPMKKRPKLSEDPAVRESQVFKSLFDVRPSGANGDGKYREDFMTRSAKFGLQ